MLDQKIEIIQVVFGITSIILLFSCFSIIAIMMSQKKKFILDTKIAEIEESHKREILSAQLELQEATFLHISREIHDNISSTLLLTKLQLACMNTQQEEQVENGIRNSIDRIDRVMDELNKISKTLSSDLIRNNGLIHAIENEVSLLKEGSNYRITLELPDEQVFIDSENELLIFRIIQEGLNNIVKHSRADEINIRIIPSEQNLTVELVDNGVGFNYASTMSGRLKGVGLLNIKKRVQMLSGIVEIVTAEGQGTTIRVLIPIQNKH